MVKEFVFDRIYGVASPLLKFFFHNYVGYLSIKNIGLESLFSYQINEWDLPLRSNSSEIWRVEFSALTSIDHDVNLNFGNDGTIQRGDL